MSRPERLLHFPRVRIDPLLTAEVYVGTLDPRRPTYTCYYRVQVRIHEDRPCHLLRLLGSCASRMLGKGKIFSNFIKSLRN